MPWCWWPAALASRPCCRCVQVGKTNRFHMLMLYVMQIMRWALERDSGSAASGDKPCCVYLVASYHTPQVRHRKQFFQMSQPQLHRLQDILAAREVDRLVAAHGPSKRLRVLYTFSRV